MYVNLEIVMIGAISKDDVIEKVFREGGNVHDENTKMIFGIDKSDPSWDEKRRVAKIYIFRRNYGGGLDGMYKSIMLEYPDLKLTLKELKDVDKAYFEGHPAYSEYYDWIMKEVVSKRELSNVFGRKRIFLGNESNIKREGLNFPVQSSAADLMNYSIINVFEERKNTNLKFKLVATVHDSLVCLVPYDEIRKCKKFVEGIMERDVDVKGKNYNFKTDCEIGKSYGEMIEWDVYEKGFGKSEKEKRVLHNIKHDICD